MDRFNIYSIEPLHKQSCITYIVGWWAPTSKYVGFEIPIQIKDKFNDYIPLALWVWCFFKFIDYIIFGQKKSPLSFKKIFILKHYFLLLWNWNLF
jgi:hypothetical protein